MTTKMDKLVADHGKVETFDPKVTPIRPATAFRIEAINAASVAPPKPSEYLIKGVIEPGQVSLWFGPAGNGKSFLMLHLAYAIARGEPVFDRRVRGADTLFLALEGRGGMDKRIYAMVKTMGPAPRFWLSGTGVQLLQTDRSGPRINVEHVEALTAFIREKNIKLAVIDTLNLTLGGADENDNSAMGLLIKAAGEIATTTGCHIAFVAHSAKAGTEGGPRGGGAQKGNADLVVSVTGEGTLTASCFAPAGKIKDGAPFKLHFKLRVVELMTDGDGDVVTSCTVEEVEAPAAGEGPKLTPAKRGWLDDLTAIFAEIEPVSRQPVSGLTCLTLTREEVRDGFRSRGRLGDVSPDGSIEPRYRQQLHSSLMSLKDAGKIGMTDKYVWLIQ